MKMPVKKVVNSQLSMKYGMTVVLWDVIDIRHADYAKLCFLGVNSKWRQGVWVKSNASILVEGQTCSSVSLWFDTAPPCVVLTFEPGAEFLHLYNIWETPYAQGSQSRTSGMIIEESENLRTYHCTDFGEDADFTRLVFQLELCPLRPIAG
ncbi:hypothetical protein HDN1F_02810 [gamma proteobacterium HdN1]|nr:hypothetical protein HDN1F_02810 [gamma proteobacterium HdN1]